MRRLFLLGILGSLVLGCSPAPHEPESQPRVLTMEDGAYFPSDRSLQRPEDGVALEDGTLIVGDQRYGLVAISTDGTFRPFGDFASAGYRYAPPEHNAAPNGVTLEPNGTHVLVADVLTGAIYRVSIESETVEKVYQHAYGVNTARRDSTGAIWFTQSTENIGAHSEEALFAAVDKPKGDGAVYRIAPHADGDNPPMAEVKFSGLDFANGFVLDEENGVFYLSETVANRVHAFKLDVARGALTDQRVVAEVSTPDNMDLHNSGELWVASPMSSQIVAVNVENGETRPVFRPENDKRDAMEQEWHRRGAAGEDRLDLLTPDLIGPMPGLITGMIIDERNGAFYVTGLGDAIVSVQTD